MFVNQWIENRLCIVYLKRDNRKIKFDNNIKNIEFHS